jgi:HEAT repeat protein
MGLPKREVAVVRSVGLALALIAFAPVLPVRGASKPSFDDLVASLKSPNAKTRIEAIEALGKSRRREAVSPLAALVHDPEAKVRLQVAKSLSDLRDLSAVPAFVTLIADEDAKVREESIGSVVGLYGERERTTPPARFLEIFSDEYDRSSVALFTRVDPSVYQALAKALQDESEGIRQEAAYSLGILDGRSAVSSLTAALQDPIPGVRGAAATAIGKVGTAEDGKHLIPLLSDESATVRNRVLQAIGTLKVREAGPALREIYESNRRRESGLKALACLSRIGDPAQADLFRELVQDPDPERKRLAVEGLARVSDASLLPAFKKDFQREHSDELKLAYAFAIARLGDHAFLDSLILCLPSATLGKRCQGYLMEMEPGILPDLYPYLSDPDAEVRAQLADILGTSGDAGSIHALDPLINDPSPKVADRATRAIERLRQSGSGGAR